MTNARETTSILPRKVCILGVNISATSYQQVAANCARWVEERRAGNGSASPARYVCVTSVHGVMMANQDATVRDTLNAADIATPDGMPVVWAMRSFGSVNQPRVYGPTLMLHVCEQAGRLGHRLFLYGSTPETIRELETTLRERFPALQIVGSYSPPFRPLTKEEDEDVVRRIRESEADIVFVGISTPKQDKWMREHRDRLPGLVMFGVGAAFDFHAGRVKQAPSWMQANGLEWFFRLITEPARLWKRYLLVTPLFLPLWALQKAGILRYDSRTA